jgi:hypothetical protein
LFAANASVAKDFDLLNTGRIEQEGTLNANAIRDTADGEISVDATAAETDHHTFKRLETFAGSLNDFDLQANRIAGANLRYIFA